MLCMRVARLVYLVFCAAAPATCDLQTMLCAVYPHRLHYLVHIPRCAAPRTRCQHKQPELIRACLHIVWNSICTEPQFTSTSMPVPLVFFFFIRILNCPMYALQQVANCGGNHSCLWCTTALVAKQDFCKSATVHATSPAPLLGLPIPLPIQHTCNTHVHAFRVMLSILAAHNPSKNWATSVPRR